MDAIAEGGSIQLATHSGILRKHDNPKPFSSLHIRRRVDGGVRIAQGIDVSIGIRINAIKGCVFVSS